MLQESHFFLPLNYSITHLFENLFQINSLLFFSKKNQAYFWQDNYLSFLPFLMKNFSFNLLFVFFIFLHKFLEFQRFFCFFQSIIFLCLIHLIQKFLQKKLTFITKSFQIQNYSLSSFQLNLITKILHFCLFTQNILFSLFLLRNLSKKVFVYEIIIQHFFKDKVNSAIISCKSVKFIIEHA